MLNLPDHTLQDEIEMTSRKAAIDVEAGGEAKDDVLVEEEAKTRPVRVPCICFDLAHRSTNYQFVVLSASVFGFYLLYGIVMEHIFQLPGLKKEGLYLTLVQFIFYTIMAKCDMIRSNETRHIPWQTYLLLAAATMTTMGLSNASLGFLNYPTQVVFKCCKLIPVLIGGILIQRKTYSMLDFYAAALMCIGLTIFTLADSKVSPNFDPTGIAMLSVALIADAVVGNVQEKAMTAHKAINAEVILYSYGIGTCYLAFFMLISGHLSNGYVAFSENPVESYGYAFIFSLTGYFGMQVVLSLVRAFGAFVAVTVTSMRKFLSIFLSFILFSKPFSSQYLFGGLVVMLGIYLNLASKSKVDFDAKWNRLMNYVLHIVKMIPYTSRKTPKRTSHV